MANFVYESKYILGVDHTWTGVHTLFRLGGPKPRLRALSAGLQSASLGLWSARLGIYYLLRLNAGSRVIGSACEESLSF